MWLIYQSKSSIVVHWKINTAKIYGLEAWTLAKSDFVLGHIEHSKDACTHTDLYEHMFVI